MVNVETTNDYAKEVAKDKLIDTQEAQSLADIINNAITQETKEFIDNLFSENAKELLSGIEKGLNNNEDLTTDDVKNYFEICKFIDKTGANVDKKLENIYTILGYKEFKNIYNTINDKHLLNLSDEELKNLYITYSSDLVPQNKSFYVLLDKVSYNDKEEKCFELLKNAYIDHVIGKITQFNTINKEGEKMGLKGERISGVGTGHNYVDERVIDKFKSSLKLSETTPKSIYNLAEYIDGLEKENKNEALGKLSLFLLKPLNDMVRNNNPEIWMPNKFVFNSDGGPSVAARNSDFITKEQDLVKLGGGSAVSKIKANKDDDSNLVEYNYVLEKEEYDIDFNNNYREINQQIENAIQDKSYTYILRISKEYENYVNKHYFQNKQLDIQLVDSPNIFEIYKEKEVLSEPITFTTKVSGLAFNEKPTTDQIAESLKTSSEFQPLLNEPEKYIINSCKVKGSASHVPTDYTSPYSFYNNIANEKLLSDDGSDTNKILAKDRAYAYISFMDNQQFKKSSDFSGFDLEYSVNGKQYENDLDNEEYPKQQYAEITLTYQKKEIDASTKKLIPPTIIGEPPELVSFGYEIPPRPTN